MNRSLIRRAMSSNPKKFSPFSVGLDDKKSDQTNIDGSETSGALSKLLNLFTNKNESKKGEKQEFPEKSDSDKTASQDYSEQNSKLDQMAEPTVQKQVLNMIESNINAIYFREKRLEPFFQKLWELKEPIKFKNENERF